jgi:hypothetical protein
VVAHDLRCPRRVPGRDGVDDRRVRLGFSLVVGRADLGVEGRLAGLHAQGGEPLEQQLVPARGGEPAVEVDVGVDDLEVVLLADGRAESVEGISDRSGSSARGPSARASLTAWGSSSARVEDLVHPLISRSCWPGASSPRRTASRMWSTTASVRVLGLSSPSTLLPSPSTVGQS